MGKRHHERRADRANADDVAEVERQLWEFAKRPDPPAVPEAKLRPGAFLYRIHRAWHSLGRGSGIASHSFRALRDELLKRDPPVRNLQPKLYGTSPVSQADASSLIDVMLETWHVARGKGTGWEATPLPRHADAPGQAADEQDLDTIRENLLHTLFKGEDTLLLEEPVGLPPEVFFEERGRSSLALILPTKSETITHLSPSNAYGGFSVGVEKFFDAAAVRLDSGERPPLLIWVLRLSTIRDNAEFHQSFHAISMHSACLTNWYFRLCRKHGRDRKQAEAYWQMIVRHSAFVIHGLPKWNAESCMAENDPAIGINDGLAELDPSFLLPESLPIVLNNHRQVRRHHNHKFGLTVSVERSPSDRKDGLPQLGYWLFPDQPRSDLIETAETTGLPVFNAELSPGADFDLAYQAIFYAVSLKLGFSRQANAKRMLATLALMGWKVLTVSELQTFLNIDKILRKFS